MYQKKKRSPSESTSNAPQPQRWKSARKPITKQRTLEDRFSDFVDAGIVVNYENMEGLLVNLGIIGALMLSFTVMVLAAVEVEGVYYGDYRFAMISSSEFRHVVHHTLVKEDFNFTVVFPKSGNEDDEILNLHEYFLDNTDANHFGCNMLLGPWHDCNSHLQNMLLTADLTYEYFNMHILYAYCTRHECEWLLSRQFEFHYGLAAAFLLVSILMSTTFYVVLMRSPIAEEVKKGKFEALKRFLFFALPFLWLGYAVLFVGSYYFFYSLVLLARLRFPSWAATQELSLDTMVYIMLPCMGLCLIGSFLSNLGSFYTIHDMLALKWLPYASKSVMNPDSNHPASVLRRVSISCKSARVVAGNDNVYAISDDDAAADLKV
jgi:hypothetical protein